MRTALVLQVLLLLSALATVHAGEGYPDFSWDHVPLYAHVGVNNGLTTDQYKFLATNFDLVMFTAGYSKNGVPVEPKVADAAIAVKFYNPLTKVLFYWCASVKKGKWVDSLSTYPGAYLIDPDTGTEYYDILRPEVRTWWAGIAAKAVINYNCGGIFPDGAAAACREGAGFHRAYGESNSITNLRNAMIDMLQEANTKILNLTDFFKEFQRT